MEKTAEQAIATINAAIDNPITVAGLDAATAAQVLAALIMVRQQIEKGAN